jgi:hypothetical protein
MDGTGTCMLFRNGQWRNWNIIMVRQYLIPQLRGLLVKMRWILMLTLVVLFANWKLLDSTNEVCEVTPFLDSYELVKEVMVTRCGTVWTYPDTGHEYLLVGDQMLWFGSQMDHSLINPNQIREYGLPVYDDPFQSNSLALMVTRLAFPSTPWGQLCTLKLVCQRIGKLITCLSLCLQGENGILWMLDLELDEAGNKPRCDRLGLWNLVYRNRKWQRSSNTN